MSMSAEKGTNPVSFNPNGGTGYVRRTSASSTAACKNQDDLEITRREKRRKSSMAAFQQNLDAELNLYIVVDEFSASPATTKVGEPALEPHIVRRRILVEPAFSRQEKTTGQGEELFRQIIFDQGITDVSLVNEVRRGISNEYELGTPQPLRNIHDYVDYSSQALVKGYIKEHAAGNIILSATFRYMVLIVILLNAILIGIETSPQLSMRLGAWFEAIENLIMACFILEILLKWYYNFDVFWKSGWNILDFVIVCILFFGSSLKFLGTSRVLRILRVIRAFRSLRDTPLFSGLSLIFQTISRSLLDMFNILLLMILIMCLLAVVGVLLFQDISPVYFGTFSDAIFSIFICQTQRGWIDIYDTFTDQSVGYYVGSWIYFVVTIVLTSFILKNMFVAVVVTSLRTEMRLAKEEQARKESKRTSSKLAIAAVPAEGKEEEEEGELRNRLEPLVEAARNWRTGDVQRRVLLPMFLNLVTVEDLHQFLFLQVALEDNLHKYHKLRASLKHVLGKVRGMNKTYFRDLRQPVSTNQGPKRRSKI